MTRHEPAGEGRDAGEELRAGLEYARGRLTDLESDRRQPHRRLVESLAAHLDEGFSLLSPEGVHLDVNPAFCAMTGFARDELVGHGLPHPYWPPEERASRADCLRHHSEGEADAPEMTFMRKNGERFPVLVRSTLICDERDQPSCIIATFRDVSELRCAEKALRESEERYRSLFEGTQAVMLLIDPHDGAVVDANPAACSWYGLGREELLAVRLDQVSTLPPAEVQARMEAVRARQPAAFADKHRLIDGTVRHVVINISPIEAQGESLLYALVHDVTKLVEAETALRVSEARLAQAQMVGHVGSWEYDPKTTRFWGSIEARRIFGFDTESSTFSTEDVEGITPERERVHQALVDLIAEGKEFDLEYDILPKDSPEPRSIWSVAEVLRGENGDPLVVTGVVQDVTRRKRADDSLRESEARYRSLFEDSPVAMWEDDYSAVKAHLEGLAAAGVGDVMAYVLADPQEYVRCLELSRTLDANQAALSLFDAPSREELLARNRDLYRRESDRGIYHLWEAMLAGVRSVTFEEANLTLRGREIQVLETCTVVPGHEETFDKVYVADVDITGRKRTEAALHESVARLERVTDGVIAALSRSVEARDPYTAGHQRRVGELAATIAGELGTGDEGRHRLALAGMLHDVGKIIVPAEILSKPGRLSSLELELIKGHAQAAYDILKPIEFDFPLAEIVVQHHERLDGSGYPAGLRGEALLPEARILAVADVVEAMISHRPYRAALPLETAMAEIEDGSGSRYDAAVCAAAVRLFREQGFAFSEQSRGAGSA